MGEEKKLLMYSRLQIARKYFHYYLTASNGKGHGVHSPFVYDFIRNVLNDGSELPVFKEIEALRARLLRDPAWVEVEDMGAGSSVAKGRRRRVREIARHAAKPRKLGQLLCRIARYYQCRRVVELGTSLGISTAYLASGAYGVRVWTIEGAAAIAAVAARNFREMELEDVELVVGNFDEKLPEVLDRAERPDLVFIDGNHRLEPTLRYFNWIIDRYEGGVTRGWTGEPGRRSTGTILVFDDIHWSKEMEAAWEAIQHDPRVYMTIDLFFIGLVVLREEFKVKQHFVIRF